MAENQKNHSHWRKKEKEASCFEIYNFKNYKNFLIKINKKSD
jgi:hypothetical protein